MQTKPHIAQLQRIAINRPRFALQQHGIHTLGLGWSGNAKSKQRNSQCSIWICHFKASDPAHTGTRYRLPQFPEAYWRDGRFAFAPRHTTRTRHA